MHTNVTVLRSPAAPVADERPASVTGRIELYRHVPPLSAAEEPAIGWWRDLAGTAAGGSVLLLGAGIGRLAEVLAKGTERLTCVEHDADKLEAMRHRLPDTAQLVHADPLAYTATDNVGLVVVPATLINGTADAGARARLMQHAARSLRPDGRLALKVLNPYWLAGDSVATPRTGTTIADDLVARERGMFTHVFDTGFDAWTGRRTGRVEYHFTDGQILTDEIDATAIYPAELRRLAAASKLEVIERHGVTPGRDALDREGSAWHLLLQPRTEAIAVQ